MFETNQLTYPTIGQCLFRNMDLQGFAYDSSSQYFVLQNFIQSVSSMGRHGDSKDQSKVASFLAKWNREFLQIVQECPGSPQDDFTQRIVDSWTDIGLIHLNMHNMQHDSPPKMPDVVFLVVQKMHDNVLLVHCYLHTILWPISHTYLRKMGHIKLMKYPHCISWCPHSGWIGKSPIQMDKSPISQDFPWLLATETNGDASTTASRMHWKRNPTQQKNLWSIPHIHQENRSLNKYELIVRLQSEYISIITEKDELNEYHHQIGIIIRKMFRTNHWNHQREASVG